MDRNRDRDAIVDILQVIEEIMFSMAGVSLDRLSTNREKQATILYFLILAKPPSIYLQSFEQPSTIDWKDMVVARLP